MSGRNDWAYEKRLREEQRLLAAVLASNDLHDDCACWRCVNRLHLWVLRAWAERRSAALDLEEEIE